MSAPHGLYTHSRSSTFGGEIGGALRATRVFRLYLGITSEGWWNERPLGDATLFSLSGVFTLGVRVTACSRFTSSPGSTSVSEAAMDVYTAGRCPLLQQGDTLSGGVGGPLVQLSLSAVTRPAAGLTVEMGYALLGLSGRVDVGRPVEMRGLWISVRLDFILGSTTPIVEEEG